PILRSGWRKASFKSSKDVRAIELQFRDGGEQIDHGIVLAAWKVGRQPAILVEAERLGIPSFDQLLDRGDVDVAITGVRFEPWHVRSQKCAILSDGIPSEGAAFLIRSSARAELTDKGQRLLLCHLEIDRRGLNTLQETSQVLANPGVRLLQDTTG